MSGNAVRITSIIISVLIAAVGALQASHLEALVSPAYSGLVITVIGVVSAALHAIPDAPKQ